MSFFKRMGSASSSANSVRSISTDQTLVDAKRPSSSKEAKAVLLKDKEISQLSEQLTNVQVVLEQAQKGNGKHLEEITALEIKLGKSECENERLLDLNQVLEDRIETLETERIEDNSYDTSELIKLKELEIAKLQAELQSYEDDNKALRQKYKAKLKTIRANNTKSKQEQSLKMFELKDEISLLHQENEQLRDKLQVLGHTELESAGGDASYEELSSPPDHRSNIIIELSTQISEQEYRISVLENQLEEKELVITKLQSAKLSPRDAHSLIAVEAQKATEEMQSLAKELKMLKRKKKKAKAEVNLYDSSEIDYSRELSSLSRDSGALDLSSPSNLKLASGRTIRHQAFEEAASYPLLTTNHSAASFATSSTLVT